MLLYFMGINNSRFNTKSGFSSKLAQSEALQAAIRESRAAYPEQFKNYSSKNQQYVRNNIKNMRDGSSGVQYQQKPRSTSPQVTTYTIKNTSPNTFDIIPKTTTVQAEQRRLNQMPQSLGKLSSVYIAGAPNWKPRFEMNPSQAAQVATQIARLLSDAGQLPSDSFRRSKNRKRKQ